MSILNSADKIYYFLLMKEMHTLGELSDEQYADVIKSIWGIDMPKYKENNTKESDLVYRPSAEAEWIPCSERLPEEHEWVGTKKFGTTISDEVYVTFESPKGERFCKYLSFQNGELSRHDQLVIDTVFKGSKPIAWMPLPKPYREDGEA